MAFTLYKSGDVNFSGRRIDAEPIGTIDHVPDVYDQIVIDDVTYVISSVWHRENICTGTAITDFHGNTQWTEEMICPYCGNEQSDAWEYNDEGETECGTCGREFAYDTDVVRTYWTRRIFELDVTKGTV